MGTNFYWLVEHQESKDIVLPTGKTVYRSSGIDHMDPNYHLGKRSGAGFYCWDCRITLCKEGPEGIHKGSIKDDPRLRWFDACPKCGKTKQDNYPSRYDRVVDEEGARPEEDDYRVPTGVAYACSFSWAQDADMALNIMMERPEEVLVEDEYGRTYKGIEFVKMLHASCPIHLNHFVGQQFS